MTTLIRKFAIVPAALALLAPVVSAQAGILHKHPMAAGVGAGMMAHHMAKKSASHGGHSMMARHPKMTGMAAGMAAHHMLKKH